ncbi:hypothetical protein O181_005749 [Austropuccinia psidii MF-1]|uniref:Uncharacterized protein n=1 Tax=Austropuccinia psidii MF-1 TaxID=1389203 RepID=A0A9Q3BI28_9BASI|nr:hypothetical protein [Austropuccinia psidii MF-1]
MSTHHYSPMCICIRQCFSTQTHYSPEGDGQGVAFTPFQYKQHIKQLKSAIFTQSTFSTPLGLTSTTQKPYSGSPNLPPQDLGMIIFAILSLRYNIPCRASRILNPALNLLIMSSISSSGGHPTPAFHMPQDLSTMFKHLQFESVIQNYICCAQCFFVNGLTESVTTDQPHCQHHNEPNDHNPPCTQSLGKFINLFEPHTQNTTNIKKNYPNKTFYSSIIQKLTFQISPEGWIHENLHQHQHSQIPKGSPKCDIWDGLVWKCFTGTRNINESAFMSIPGTLALSSYVDWFNAHGKSSCLASIGPIILICLYIPTSESLKPENFYVSGIIPGPKEKTSLQLNYLLIPLIKELKELWQGYHFSPTSTGPSGFFNCVAMFMAIVDVVAMCKLTGFISFSGNNFCNFCTIRKAQLEEIGPQLHYTHSYQNHKSTIAKWLWASLHQRQAIFSEYGVQYSILEYLPY